MTGRDSGVVLNAQLTFNVRRPSHSLPRKDQTREIFPNPKRPVILSEAKNLWLFETDAPQHKQRCFTSLNMTASFMERALIISNRKLLAHFRRHADWPPGLRVDRAPECPRF